MHERSAPSSPTRRRRAPLLALALASLLPLCACSRRNERAESVNAATASTSNAASANAQSANAQAQSPAQSASGSDNSNTPAPATPQPSEIDDKAARIFKGAVEIDPSHKTPALVGDFNGDGSEDVAFVVRPTAHGLEEINSEVSNWTLSDPQKVALPDPHEAVRKLSTPARVQAERGDLLLAVIHGYGDGGWRNPAAQQTYLLRNALGRDPKVESKQDASYRFNLRFRGDVIDQELSGSRGVLEWTGATYAWLAQKK